MKKIITLKVVVMLIMVPYLTAEAKVNCSCDGFREIVFKNPPLQGNDVKELQRELKKLGYYDQELTSTYGWTTYLAVKRFKAAYNLADNGVVNKETWLKLGEALNKVPARRTNKADISPPKGEVSILINTRKKILKVFSDEKLYHTFPVAVGKYATKSPVGEWVIVEKKIMWGEGPFGERWMELNVPWGNYGIHGTNKPGSIGTPASNGCIRMFNQDVKLLYSWVETGALVKIVGDKDPVKVTHDLRPGNKGRDVQLLQEKLRKQGFDPGYLDGMFDKATAQAVKEFKYIYGLRNGIEVGESSFNILDVPYEYR